MIKNTAKLIIQGKIIKVCLSNLILFMKRNKIIDNEQHLINLETSRSSERPDYFFGSNGCSRRIFFHHGYLLMKHLEERAESSQPLGPAEIEVKNFAQCQINDGCIYKAQAILQKLENLQRENDSDTISAADIMNSCYEEYKAEIWENILLVVVASISMLLMILSLQFMLEELFSFQTQSKTKLYLLITLTIFLNTLMDLFDQNLYYESLNLFLKAKQPFILLFYVKTMGLISYNIKNQNIERLINSISSDFNIIGQTLGYLIIALRTPIKFIGITLFLIVKLKWAGAVAALIMLMTIPVYYLVGKKTGDIMGEVNNLKDQRIKFYTQIIDGIKFIKIYGWEVAFTHIIQTLRNEQISGYLKYYFFSSLSQGLAQVSVLLSGYVSYFILYSSGQAHLLSTVTLLVKIQAIVNLKVPMYQVSFIIPNYYTLLSVLERFAKILNIKPIQMEQLESEHENDIFQQKFNPSNAIQVQNFYAYWMNQKDQQKEPTLKNISISLEKNEFYGITGKVGSGKSSFFQIFLKQFPFYKGNYFVNGKVAYVEQQPILFSETVQMNILMGQQFNKRKYQEVLEKSCFTTDLEDLENGDQTVIGQKGIKLSGGQRVRLSLARALYSDADILLLDDPIAALDSKVSKSVFQKSILPLKGLKTILLITHQLHFLLKCSKVILFEGGEIKAFEKPEKLNLSKLSKLKQEKEEESVEEKNALTNIQTQEAVELLQNMEKRQNVSLGISVYLDYFFSSKLNWILLPITVILFLIIEMLAVIFFSVLSTYDKVVNGENTFLEDVNSFWLFLGLIQVCYCFLTPMTFLLLNLVIFNSNSAIHQKMVRKLIRSQAFYFDVIPSNQLLSRFSNDLTVLDTLLSYSFKVMFEKSTAVLVALVTVSSLNLSFIIVLVIGMTLCLMIVAKYKNKIIYSRKVYLLAKDPIFKDFTQGVSGNLQLRLANQCKNRVSLFGEKLNREFQTVFAGYLLSRTLGLWLCYTCLFFIYLGLIMGAYFLHEDEANLFGFQIILLIRLNTSIQHMLRETIENQAYIISAERTLQVTQFKSEADLTTQYDQEYGIKVNYDTEKEEGTEVTNSFDSLKLWPESPSVLVENLKLRYREELPLVLKQVSFKIKEGQRVGIVGRTGAGKSSIFQALLRMTEPEPTSTYHIGATMHWKWIILIDYHKI